MSAEFASADADIHHAKIRGGASGPVIAAVTDKVLGNHFQAVIVWHGMVCLPEILHALKNFGGRVLVHGGNPAHSMPKWVNLRYLLREKRLGRRCEATYVCCSRYVADSFVRSNYLRRFPRVVVPNGAKPLTVPVHVPRKIGWKESFTIGMVARLDHIKDHPTLLRAFAKVLAGWPTARLELAGDGERKSGLEQLSRELGIEESVSFLGTVENVYRVMAGWDVFAYATTDQEGLGNALVEAMAYGLPCVVTETGPMREVAGQQPVVVLVDKANPHSFALAVNSLIESLEKRKALSSQARSRAEKEFSEKTFAQRHVRLLEGDVQT